MLAFILARLNFLRQILSKISVFLKTEAIYPFMSSINSYFFLFKDYSGYTGGLITFNLIKIVFRVF